MDWEECAECVEWVDFVSQLKEEALEAPDGAGDVAGVGCGRLRVWMSYAWCNNKPDILFLV